MLDAFDYSTQYVEVISYCDQHPIREAIDRFDRECRAVERLIEIFDGRTDYTHEEPDQ